LKFIDNESAKRAVKLNLANGLKLSYGEILMLAGDMFGDPQSPISNCTVNERQSCFLKQFNALANTPISDEQNCSNPAYQVSQLLNYSEKLSEKLNEARQQGINDWDFYQDTAAEINKSMNKYTCGGSFLTDYFPFGNYLKLAQVNFDHFVPDSLIAYKAGHLAALEQAKEAFKMWHDEKDFVKSQQLLHYAYAKNAFANHYLSDSLSSGHMRVPRRQISEQLLLPAVLKLLIANLMHDEDNQYGLNVINKKGTSWYAYGDGYFFHPNAAMHRYMMNKIIQASADAIFKTYQTGIIPSHYDELDLVPDYSKVEQINDTTPLFKVINGHVYKRKDKHDRYSSQWTKHWSGLLTLLLW